MTRHCEPPSEQPSVVTKEKASVVPWLQRQRRRCSHAPHLPLQVIVQGDGGDGLVLISVRCPRNTWKPPSKLSVLQPVLSLTIAFPSPLISSPDLQQEFHNGRQQCANNIGKEQDGRNSSGHHYFP